MRKAAGFTTHMAEGMRSLSSGKVFRAMGLFKKAVDATTPDKRAQLHRALFWLGVSALRIGRRDVALKALASARRLDRRGPAQALYSRIGNGYGMPRQAKPEDDDRLAFFSIQIARYLRLSPRKAFSGSPERDMVLSLIASAWSDLRASSLLHGMSTAKKAELFHRAQISFPRMAGAESGLSEVLRVDFRRKCLAEPGQRCPCGSGLPQEACCAAAPSYSSLSSGLF